MTTPRPDQEQPHPEASERAPEVADEVTDEVTKDASQPAADAPDGDAGSDHGTLQPQPRPGLDRRLDGDPEGTHVCAPTDA